MYDSKNMPGDFAMLGLPETLPQLCPWSFVLGHLHLWGADLGSNYIILREETIWSQRILQILISWLRVSKRASQLCKGLPVDQSSPLGTGQRMAGHVPRQVSSFCRSGVCLLFPCLNWEDFRSVSFLTILFTFLGVAFLFFPYSIFLLVTNSAQTILNHQLTFQIQVYLGLYN